MTRSSDVLSPKPLAEVVVMESVSGHAPPALSYAAGLCGRLAADMGAQVTRVDQTHVKPSFSALDHFLHRGKARFPIHAEKSVQLTSDLAQQADVLICDYAMWAKLAPVTGPLAVVLSMSWDAPMAGSEFTMEARSGLLDLVGDPERQPLRLGGHQTAYAAGLAAYLGLVSGLAARQNGRDAGPVHVSVLDVAVWLNWKTLSLVERTGKAPGRGGAAAEWHVVACADGSVALVYRAAEWRRLMEATGDTRLAAEHFQSVAGRKAHRRELNSILADIFVSKTRLDIHALSLAHKLPLGPVWTPAELIRDPQMIARDAFAWVKLGDRLVAIPRLPVKWNRTVIESSRHDRREVIHANATP